MTRGAWKILKQCQGSVISQPRRVYCELHENPDENEDRLETDGEAVVHKG